LLLECSLAKFKIIPVIFPQKNSNYNRLFDLLSYHHQVFDTRKDIEMEKRIIEKLISKLKSLIKNWIERKPIRSMIEEVFKLA